MKKVLSLLLVVVMILAVALTCASCGEEDKPADETPAAYGFEGTKEVAKQGSVNTTADQITLTGDVSKVKIGLIMIGDETEGYTKAHMDGIKNAAKNLGIADDQLIWKLVVPETDAVVTAGNQLIADGCTYVFSNSYGHQSYMQTLAEENPTIHFVAATGDTAAALNYTNFSNCFTGVYQSRYVSGVVAGLKLKELIDGNKLSAENKDKDGNYKIGYVGAFNYAEVVSGYTAFYLGIKSIVPEVAMQVQYTSSWFDFDKEKAAAQVLIGNGCCIIGQHADSAGAPTAVEEALKNGKVVYSVGYNVSMLDACPTGALTSATNNWTVYYQYALACAINGENIATNWAAGYEKNAVGITEFGPACAAGTEAKVNETVAGIKNGSIKVFDTSKFTVGGKTVTWAFASDTNGDWTNDANNVISDGQFLESYVQAAPAFALRIDGITELN